MWMIQLRDYQNELIEGIYQSMSKGNTKIMVVSPAGSGKSVT
ncbi:DEAD/DEAH box helicase family protein, partial [Staphylococcus haemolyticus]